MRYFIVLLIFFSTIPLFGQIEEEVNDSLLGKDWARFYEFTENLSKRAKNISANWTSMRDLTQRHQECIFYFGESSANTQQSPSLVTNRFKLNLIHNGKEIIFYELSEIQYKNAQKSYVRLHQYKNEIYYGNFKWAYHELYGADVDENDLFLEDIVYGENCGIAGTNPKEKDSIDAFVAKKDTASLLKWLQSPNSEKQVYAVNGFYELRKAGRMLTEQEEKIIAFIIHKKGEIHTCSGCMHDSNEIKYITRRFFSSP